MQADVNKKLPQTTGYLNIDRTETTSDETLSATELDGADDKHVSVRRKIFFLKHFDIYYNTFTYIYR